MQRLHQFRYRQGLPGDVIAARTAHAKHALKFMGEDLDESWQHLHPVIKNMFCSLTAGQLEVLLNETVDQFYIARLNHWLKIDRCQVAALLGEITPLIEDIRDATAHACGEIPAAGA